MASSQTTVVSERVFKGWDYLIFALLSIDPRHEAGFHWRSGLLTLAKWPFILLALFDLLKLNRAYTLTRKTRSASKCNILLMPHVLIIALIGSACAIGMILRHIRNPILLMSSGIIMLSSLGLILKEWLKFPDPYDPDLRAKERVKQVVQLDGCKSAD